MKKLRRISVQSISEFSLTPKELVDQAPQLQFLVSNSGFESTYQMINNTIAIHRSFLDNITTLADLQKIGPILQSSNYINGLLQLFKKTRKFTLSKKCCEYLFRELKLDINQYFLKSEAQRNPFVAPIFDDKEEVPLNIIFI